MKRPLPLTLLILCIGTPWGLRQHRYVSCLREQQQRLMQQAVPPGRSGAPAHPDAGPPARQGDDGEQTSERAARIAALANQLNEDRTSGRLAKENNLRLRLLDVLEPLLSLENAQLLALAGELKTRTDMTDETKRYVLSGCVVGAARRDPAGVLRFLANNADIANGPWEIGILIAPVLARLANDDPRAATDWVDANPDRIRDYGSCQMAVLVGAGQHDFGRAFAVADEWVRDSGKRNMYIVHLANLAVTCERQLDYLAALRAHARRLDNPQQSDDQLRYGMSVLFSMLAHAGCDRADAWLKRAELSDRELDVFAASLYSISTRHDVARWLELVLSRHADAHIGSAFAEFWKLVLAKDPAATRAADALLAPGALGRSELQLLEAALLSQEQWEIAERCRRAISARK